jgi:hypothetical protein
MNTMTAAAIVIAVIAAAIAVWALIQVRTTRHLRSKFGPEYEYEVRRIGDQRRAEAELAKREARVRKLQIRTLTPQERERFADQWRREQARFVDDPAGAVTAADTLVTELMVERGYPTTAEASVDYPHVMNRYREAHEIADRNRRGDAGTEDLRGAMICYRALFEELLGTSTVEHEVVRR